MEFQFTQPAIEVTEGQDAVAAVCIEALSGPLSIAVQVHLNTVPVISEGTFKNYSICYVIHVLVNQKE